MTVPPTSTRSAMGVILVSCGSVATSPARQLIDSGNTRWPSCPHFCPDSFIGDGYCDQTCNSAACLYDGGDCGHDGGFEPYTCSGCTALGYVWCPGAALCYAQPSVSRPGDSDMCPYSAWVNSSGCDSKYESISDPLYEPNQWAYDLINVEPVWASGVTGAGVTINIVDLGPDHTHPDFEYKYDSEASCPRSEINIDNHGTTCAAIALASANNECSRGVAYDANLSKCSFRENSLEEMMSLHSPYALETNMISSNSWGVVPCSELDVERRSRFRRLQTCPFAPVAVVGTSPCDSCTDSWLPGSCDSTILEYCTNPYNYEADEECAEWTHLWTECSFQHLNPLQVTYFMRGVHSGRSGLGIVYVFAAGNGHGEGDDVNHQLFQHDRFTISVGATDKRGRHSYYSTTGASLFISAPGGDAGDHTNNYFVASNGGGCAAQSQGTSYACPVVSGVVALMLEAAPHLTHRDVQGVLAETSYVTDPDDEGWTTNAAGYHHNVKFGFGMVDANAAVMAARSWTKWTEESLVKAHGLGEFRLPVTTEGCVCRQAWVHHPHDPVSNFCGNPGGDAGEWCFVTDPTCQGATWGYCADAAPLPVVVPHDGTTLARTVEVDAPRPDFFTEWVEVYLFLDHTSRGDLQVELTSPSGTRSVLMPGPRPEDENPAPLECSPATDTCSTRNDGVCDNPSTCACDYNDCEEAGWIGAGGAGPSLRHPTFNWKMTTVRAWGEVPDGTWTLSVTDTKPDSVAGLTSHLYSWDLFIYGHYPPPSSPSTPPKSPSVSPSTHYLPPQSPSTPPSPPPSASPSPPPSASPSPSSASKVEEEPKPRSTYPASDGSPVVAIAAAVASLGVGASLLGVGYCIYSKKAGRRRARVSAVVKMEQGGAPVSKVLTERT